MGTLRGHSRPVNIILLDSVLDHTYVTCAAGHCWPCWGDCLDGSILRTGQGSTARAEAIAGPDGGAGIDYGVTGLCMQTANRILWPAGVTVSDAMGYDLTSFVYGHYGPSAADWLAHRDASDGVTGETPQCDGTESPEENPAGTAGEAFWSFITGIYERFAPSEPPSEEPTSNLELLGTLLAARLQEKLGARVADRDIVNLQEIQRACVEEKAPIDRAVRAGGLRGDAYADQVNRVINGALRNMAQVLEPDAYAAFFNVRPGAQVAVIRPDIAAGVYPETRTL